jgi:hypothetical protein
MLNQPWDAYHLLLLQNIEFFFLNLKSFTQLKQIIMNFLMTKPEVHNSNIIGLNSL